MSNGIRQQSPGGRVTPRRRRGGSLALLRGSVLLLSGPWLLAWIVPGESESYICTNTSRPEIPTWATPDLIGGLYSASSNPFLQPLPEDARLHTNSALFVEGLKAVASSANEGIMVAYRNWTVPVYVANAPGQQTETPVYDVPMLISWMRKDPRFDQLSHVPIPSWARPDPAGDGHMVIVDLAFGLGGARAYEFWGYCPDLMGRRPTAGWGNVMDVQDDGVFDLVESPEILYGLSGRASGFAALNGMIWPGELESGVIEHALVFSYPQTMLLPGGPVSPATASDTTRPPDPTDADLSWALPEGARVRIDPSLDLDTIPMEPWQQTIAVALQKYGMFLGDGNDGVIVLYAVNPQSYPEGTRRYEGSLGDLAQSSSLSLPAELADHFQVVDFGEQIGDGNEKLNLDPDHYE